MIIEFNFEDDNDFGIEDIEELSNLHNKQVRYAIVTSVIEAVENGQAEAPFLIVQPGDMQMAVQPADYMNALELHAPVLVEMEEFEWAQRAQKARIKLEAGWPLGANEDDLV